MKLSHSMGGLAVAAFLAIGSVAFAEERVATTTATTTTESAGTISEFGNDTIAIRTETATAPVTYRYSKETTYVDDAGQPVSIETVKSGLPVTVHYVKDGDRLVA